MIETKKALRECINYEKNLYSHYMFNSPTRYYLSYIKREPARIIYHFLVLLRKSEYYKQEKKIGVRRVLSKILYIYYTCRKNRFGEKLGLEVSTRNTNKGLLIYHYNNVINGDSVIGKNCHLHGNNCIGNNGITNECPIIGDNVSLGVGAKVIGPVKIGNNIKIAAGAVVVSSFLEDGITIGGIPAKRIK